MLKLLLLSLLFITSIFAGEKVKIYASSMETQNNIVRASDGVTVIYKDYIITADSAKYDKASGDLELYEKIRVNHGGQYKILGNYAKLNIAKKERLFRPFYMLEKESQLWISANEAKTQAETIDISSGTMSGCDPMDAIWTMDFSSSDYDTEDKWMNLYNARLYIGDIPIFYTPYFGYSLDTTRRSGLLMPQFGLSDSEGFYLEQPIYIAPHNWWDLELKPQVRTNRGAGIYQTFRFVDGKSSHGEITAGYFKENNDYFLQNNLQNDSHYGFNIKYDNNDFINQWLGTDFGGQSGIYVDVNHMNDVDYINLGTNNTENQATATQVLSRINMFYNSDNHYFGSYFKYYQDLTKATNEDTLQKLPTFQYHHYLDTFFKDHLLYSLDVQANNLQREINTNVLQTDINLPITLQTTLFDEYLNLSYKANLYMQHSRFSGEQKEPVAGLIYRDGYYARNYHTISASTQLTRSFENFSHVIGLALTYNKSGNDTKNGFYEDYVDANDTIKDKYNFYQISGIEDEMQIDFIQYIYDSSSKQIIFHRLAQKIAYTDTGDKLGELENELEYQITDYLSFYNNMFYNYDKGQFSKIFNSARVNKYGVNLSIAHLYKDSFKLSTPTTQQFTNYLTSNVSYTYDKHYSYTAAYNYDIQAQEQKNLSVGFMYKKRCWDFGIRYSENRRPILTNTGEADYLDDRYIYVSIVLKPLMQSNSASSFLTYKLPE